jgi:1-acyl-sn-glycerol-3-phosphate acyltransferase
VGRSRLEDALDPEGRLSGVRRNDAAQARGTGLRTALQRAGFLAGFLAGGIWFFFCSAVGLVALVLTGGSRDTVHQFARWFCGGVARLMGWKIEIDGEKLAASQPCVIVSNHQSIMDVLVFGAIVPRRTVALAKVELTKIPLFGWFFVRSGNLVIDRGNSEAAKEMLAAAGRRLQAEGLSVWITPEGHRNDSGQLLPFKTGAFRLAASAWVPIVPVVAEPLEAVVDTRRLLARRGRLRISVLDPVAPLEGAAAESEETVRAQASRVRAAMQAEYDRLSGLRSATRS